MKNSEFLSINVKNILHGLVAAVGGALFSVLKTSIETGNFNVDPKQMGLVAAGAGLSYVGTLFFHNSTGDIAPEVITPDQNQVSTAPLSPITPNLPVVDMSVPPVNPVIPKSIPPIETSDTTNTGSLGEWKPPMPINPPPAPLQ